MDRCSDHRDIAEILFETALNTIQSINQIQVFIFQTVTFQVVYITDGSKSYSFYYYKEDGMNIPYGRVFIGLIEDGIANGFTNSRDGSFLRRPDKNLFSGGNFLPWNIVATKGLMLIKTASG